MTTRKSTTFLCFDPRDPLQSLDDPATWQPSDNAILITATMLLAGDDDPNLICWEKVAALADLCDDADAPIAGADHRIATIEETNALLCETLSKVGQT